MAERPDWGYRPPQNPNYGQGYNGQYPNRGQRVDDEWRNIGGRAPGDYGYGTPNWNPQWFGQQAFDPRFMDEFGYTNQLPGSHIAPEVQHMAERRVAARNDQLMADALGRSESLYGESRTALRSGLGMMQAYRPGGLAALASPYYGNLAQSFQNQAGQYASIQAARRTEAPDLMYWRNDQIRKSAEEDAKKAGILGGIGQLAGTALGFALGGPAGAAAGGALGGAVGGAAGGGAGAGMAGGGGAAGAGAAQGAFQALNQPQAAPMQAGGSSSPGGPGGGYAAPVGGTGGSGMAAPMVTGGGFGGGGFTTGGGFGGGGGGGAPAAPGGGGGGAPAGGGGGGPGGGGPGGGGPGGGGGGGAPAGGAGGAAGAAAGQAMVQAPAINPAQIYAAMVDSLYPGEWTPSVDALRRLDSIQARDRAVPFPADPFDDAMADPVIRRARRQMPSHGYDFAPEAIFAEEDDPWGLGDSGRAFLWGDS